jgi:N-acetylglucosaminyl-diphospho-decaprenol L-rhamnosyltransferase
MDLVLRTAGLHVMLKGITSYPFLPSTNHANSGYVGQVMGAVMMVRRSLFRDLSGFDERFFLYYEDVDLSARAAERGVRSFYNKDAHAIHIGRASSSQDSGMALALFLRSALTYARVHFGVLLQSLLITLTYVVELPLRLVRTLFRGRSIAGRAVFRAYGLLSLNLVTGVSIPTLAARRRAG